MQWGKRVKKGPAIQFQYAEGNLHPTPHYLNFTLDKESIDYITLITFADMNH